MGRGPRAVGRAPASLPSRAPPPPSPPTLPVQAWPCPTRGLGSPWAWAVGPEQVGFITRGSQDTQPLWGPQAAPRECSEQASHLPRVGDTVLGALAGPELHVLLAELWPRSEGGAVCAPRAHAGL